MSDFIVGLTGGVASGKSALSRRFEAKGIVVADADVAARAVVAPGHPALAQIVIHFGTQLLREDGSLDRAALRQRIFEDPVARRDLEAITHPAIRALLQQACREAASPYAVAAIPLLTEVGARAAYPWLDRIVVVDAPEATQHARLMQRDGISAELAQRMIAAQATRAARLAIADDVVVNDGDAERLQDAADALDRQYRALAAAKLA
ncbi:dephospho-CoA kinase [Xanthomonas translucens pv. undulosa]|uniref:dephospho-CoA kinase n=1 Tax=Xanthomonas campestris pv. translucens TaxID=343 RepID=UPI0019D612E1|nr:dephospho-CoA kinase [Xanthomonas translucens]QSQ42947.1 dephospho-CoA kinase [Xanthomonas translucens pv. translucens]QSQ49203.1 dephospho-CoA kinase [Xanthomonas translucens pv. undulosa]QSQ51604.1 dephospho-CoA kinase [Xanthomonas translucens pv. undulosa]QSQ59480.1 dephospho-CoA kinase [Xanthomonas translucens pv. undulosa]UNU11782.1 dephospho-CoA kinase [Xanthomonas translucens pv. translucens]